MESIPTGQVSTRAGARNKSATTTKVDAAKDKAKPRGKANVEAGTTSDPSDIDQTQTIATTAYFLAAARNFEPGHELEDWLEAERRVRAAVR